MLTTGGTDTSHAEAPYRTGVRGDVLLYAASAVLAAALAVVTIYHGHRVWGVIAAAAYAAGAVATLLTSRLTSRQTSRHGAGHRARMAIASPVFLAAALVPLVVLVLRRAQGVPWSAQPEVDVVERMGRLLVATGTPYADIDTLAHFQDYAPYLPAMAVFGLPRAVFGDTPVTDVRLVFLVVAALITLLAVRSLAAQRLPVRAVHLVAVLPATALAVATGGDDLPVLALLILCFVRCHHDRTRSGAVAGGVALAMKLTAAPVLLVLAIALRARQGTRRAVAFAATALGVAAVLVLPAALVSPAELVEHVIRFPAGMANVESPAASPLPGYLLAQTGEAGRLAALALLGLAALAILAWLLRRPPQTTAQAAERAAISLVVAMLLMPATRFGYLIYPFVLAGTAIALRPTSSWSWSLRHDRAR